MGAVCPTDCRAHSNTHKDTHKQHGRTLRKTKTLRGTLQNEGEGGEAREARRWKRGGGSEATGAMPEQAKMAKSADFLPVLRADCSLEHESG